MKKKNGQIEEEANGTSRKEKTQIIKVENLMDSLDSDMT